MTSVETVPSQLPNVITLGRLAASGALFALLSAPPSDSESHALWAWFCFALFVVTAATDWLDGYLARRLGSETLLGRILDPFVDKVVICGSSVLLLGLEPARESLHPWMVVVILSREFFVNGLRGVMEARGVSFGAAPAGKAKMVLQCLAIGALLFQRAAFGVDPDATPTGFGRLVSTLVYGMVIVTVLSAVPYGRRAWPSLRRRS